MSFYFWPYGKCCHCGWPHHYRHDVPARPARRFLWWQRPERAAYSFVSCCNCGHRTPLPAAGGES